MTFQVCVKCLICRKLADSTINSEKAANAESLNNLHSKLCRALKLEFLPKFQEWDFAEEPFPYCESCCQRLQRLGELIDQLKSIEEEMSGSLATLSALVITSDHSDSGNSDPLITPKLGQAKEYFKSRRLQGKHNHFRSLIIQRFNPRVNVQHYDDNCNNPSLSNDDYVYELVPISSTVIKTEPAFEDFPDTAGEDATFNEIEFKIETSSDVTDPEVVPESNIGLDEARTPLSPTTLALTLASSASDKLYDEASKTYQMGGFKFKTAKSGYECCTCGQVSAISHPSKQHNIKRHIKTVHMRVSRSDTRRGPRVCEDCGKVFLTFQNLYQHRLRLHGTPKFQCGHCEAHFPFRWLLRKHLAKHKEKEKEPSQSGKSSLKTVRSVRHSRLLRNREKAEQDKLENPTTSTVCKVNDLVKKVLSQQFDSFARDGFKTEELNGFKFKAVENGYECCTCGRVISFPNGSYSKQKNIKRHIKAVHMGVPRSNTTLGTWACEECGEVFSTKQRRYVHRVKVHPHPTFQCGHCGIKCLAKSKLKQHIALKHQEKGEATLV